MEDKCSSKIYVAVGKEIEERRSTLKWVLNNLRGKNICFIHVHVPSLTILLPDGSKATVSSVTDTEIIKEFRERERQETLAILDDCTQMFATSHVPSVHLHIEKESITSGILEVISQLKIRILVMGTSTGHEYSRKMDRPMSKKTKYVLDYAPDYCDIWFVSKDELIYQREGIKKPNSDTEDPKQAKLTTPCTKQSMHHGDDFFEKQFYTEYSLRKALEENLANGKEELEKMKRLWEILSRELRTAVDNQIEKSNVEVKILEEEIVSAVDLLQKVKRKCDIYETERDTALQENAELKKLVVQGQSLAEFSSLELQKATNSRFDQTSMIGEEGYRCTYRGVFCHTEVAIKMFDCSGISGPREFNQQVAVINKLRHPKIVTLIGICPESLALVYEYLPGGSLKDRLICKNNTPPLPWQTRIQIATDICSALIFMHSSQPDCIIIHGNLKPHNVLLDEHSSCKLTDFSISNATLSNAMPNAETKDERVGRIYTTVRNCSMKYIDPAFLSTGVFTTKSDVYSFGIILLRLLTGLSAVGIAKNVRNALVRDELESVLDSSAGEWPVVHAVLIARLGLSCCDVDPENRPDLESDVLRVLQPMNGSGSGAGSGSGSGSELGQVLSNFEQPPYHFRCPISMEIMEDPHMAADGFTYEGRDIWKWLDGGCHTSPMTGLRLDNLSLVPNRSLRSGIQEWLQHCQNV